MGNGLPEVHRTSGRALAERSTPRCVYAGRVCADGPIRLTDALPQRIVALAPSNTEQLWAVGAGPTVVGVMTVDI